MTMMQMYKELPRFDDESNEGCFITFGTFKSLIFKEKEHFRNIELPMLSSKSIHEKKTKDSRGLSQILAFDISETRCEQSKVESILNPHKLLEKTATQVPLPLCAITTISNDGIPYSSKHNEFRANMEKHLNSYHAKLKDFHEKNKDMFPNSKAEMHILLTTSCVDVVLVIRTNSYLYAAAFINYLKETHSYKRSYTVFGYSDRLFTEPNLFSSTVDIEKIECDVLLRTIDTRDGSIAKEAKSILTTRSNSHHMVAGTYDERYSVSGDNVRAFFNDIYGSSGVCNNDKNRREFGDISRIWLKFDSCIQQQGVYGDHASTKQKNEFEKLLEGFENICILLNEGANITNEGKGVLPIHYTNGRHYNDYSIAGIRDYTSSLHNILYQHIAFFEHLASAAKKGINPEIMPMLKSALEMLSYLASEYHNSVLDIAKDFDQPNFEPTYLSDSLPRSYSNFLVTFQEVLTSIGTFTFNIARTHESFLEAGGFFEDDVSITTSMTYGYYYFVREISKELLKIGERNPGNVTNCAYFVRLDAKPSRVITREHFGFLQRSKQNDYNPDLQTLISLRIAHHIAFEFERVRRDLTHECLHHIGERNRDMRADAILETLCRWFGDQIFQHSFNEEVYREKAEMQDALSIRMMEFFNDDVQDNVISKVYEELLEPIVHHLKNLMLRLAKNKYKEGVADGVDTFNWTFIHSLKKCINEIFESFFEYEKHPSNWHDFVKLVIDKNVELKRKYLAIFLDWNRKKQCHNEDSKLMADYEAIRILADEKHQSISSEFGKYRELVYQLLGGFAIPHTIYLDFDVDEKGNLITKKPSAPSHQEPTYRQKLTNVSKFLDYVCDAATESFCDIGMLKLFPETTPKQYFENLELAHKRPEYTDYRIYLVYKAFYAKENELLPAEFANAMKDISPDMEFYLEPLIAYLKESTDSILQVKQNNPSLFIDWKDNEQAFMQLYSWGQLLREEGKAIFTVNNTEDRA